MSSYGTWCFIAHWRDCYHNFFLCFYCFPNRVAVRFNIYGEMLLSRICSRFTLNVLVVYIFFIGSVPLRWCFYFLINEFSIYMDMETLILLSGDSITSSGILGSSLFLLQCFSAKVYNSSTDRGYYWCVIYHSKFETISE